MSLIYRLVMLILVTVLVMELRRSKKLQTGHKMFQEALQTKAMQKLVQERDLLLASYTKLLRGYRKERQEFDELEYAFDVALSIIKDMEEQYGVPARRHEDRSSEETNPFGISLDHLIVIPTRHLQ